MLRFPSFFAAASLSVSLLAQPVYVSTPRPVSIARTGPVASGAMSPVVGSNGESFLVAWLDDRVRSYAHFNQAYGSSLLMRVGADGVPLDEFPIATPFTVKSITWTGREWVAGGDGNGIVRISAEGELIATRMIEVENFSGRGLAWTGNALVLVGVTYRSELSGFKPTGVKALTLNAELEVIGSSELSSVPSEIIGVSGDGQSAVAFWRDDRSYSFGTSLHGASFGADGVVHALRSNLLPVLEHPYSYDLSIGATGLGYVVLYYHFSGAKLAAWFERDLTKRNVPLELDNSSGATSMAWDGEYLTHYSTREEKLFATRFTLKGHMAAPPQQVGTLGGPFPHIAAAGIAGRTLVVYTAPFEPQGPQQPLLMRSFESIAFGSAPERRMPDAVRAQDHPVGVSNASQSLVGWLERTSISGRSSLYAARLDRDTRVLDPESLLLSTTACEKLAPAVATNGDGFVAAWHDEHGLRLAAISSDGSVTNKLIANVATPCSERLVRVASNGTDYLALWTKKIPQRSSDYELLARRLSAAGEPLDSAPISVAILTADSPFNIRFEAVSNGQDYLIAWDNSAVRLTRDGAILDAKKKIQLGVGDMYTMWWNGTNYVVHTVAMDGTRFLRIGSDGTGGRSPRGAQAPTVAVPGNSIDWVQTGLVPSTACDATGCWVAGVTRKNDAIDTPVLMRYDDDGTQITVRRHDAANLTYFSPADRDPIVPAVINAGRPAIIYLPQRMERPFASVHRVMIAPLMTPRARAVRH